MTGYASVTRELETATDNHSMSVCVELRTVNARFLDLNFKMPEDLRNCEPTLREMLMAKLSRGKIEIRINLQRSERAANIGILNQHALDRLTVLQRTVHATFPDAQPLHVEEILRWPGVLVESEIALETLRAVVFDCSKQAIADLINVRAREGARLSAIILEKITAMEAIVARITPLVPELISKYQQKIVKRLQEALGMATVHASTTSVSHDETTERIRQEVTMYGIRIDIAEELSRLIVHLKETRHIIEKGGIVGKRLDFMMQELNREANTLGSKALLKELSDASMTLRLLIEQIREQVQNLE